MARKQGPMRVNTTLQPKDAKRLNEYCLKIAQRNGKIPHDLYAKIGRMAFKEWLDKHENDLTIDFNKV